MAHREPEVGANVLPCFRVFILLNLGGKLCAEYNRRDADMLDEKQTLTPTDREEILAHLDRCLSIFTRKDGLLTAVELQLKTMLSTVRRQLDVRTQVDSRRHGLSDI
jgi:hypothetical protein